MNNPNKPLAQRCFPVGGAVRDELLGLEVKDRDWVVVGSTPAEMRRHGFRQVGTDFPVFLHPQTHEEYALARTERKSGTGYQGFVCDFSPDVTLEEDLQRRDLTINAMAIRNGELVDPWGGQADLNRRTLRHVSDAFSEDPLRVLRVARFASRFSPLGFSVASETVSMMSAITRSGELNTLTPERVWTEWQRALDQADADTFLKVLDHCGALRVLLPELDRDRPSLNVIRNPLHRYALLFDKSESAVASSLKTPCERLKVPTVYARLVQLCQIKLPKTAAQACELFERADLKRRPEQLDDYLAVKKAQRAMDADVKKLRVAAHVWRSVTPQALMDKGLSGAELGVELTNNRALAVEQFW